LTAGRKETKIVEWKRLEEETWRKEEEEDVRGHLYSYS